MGDDLLDGRGLLPLLGEAGHALAFDAARHDVFVPGQVCVAVQGNAVCCDVATSTHTCQQTRSTDNGEKAASWSYHL